MERLTMPTTYTQYNKMNKAEVMLKELKYSSEPIEDIRDELKTIISILENV